MGNQALLLALAAVLGTSLLLFSARQSTQGSDRELAQHTFRVVARDAAVTGLNLTVQKLVSDTSSWQVDPSVYEYTDAPYRQASFTTEVSSPYGVSELNEACWVDTVDVISTGFSEGDTAGTHRIEATFVRTCGDAAGTSTGTGFPLATDQKLTLSGDGAVFSAYTDVNASIHSNSELSISGGSGVRVDGYATSTGTITVGSTDNVIPMVDEGPLEFPIAGTDYVGYADSVDIPMFNPADYDPTNPSCTSCADYMTAGDYKFDVANTVVDFTNFHENPKDPSSPLVSASGKGTESDPFIWYISGKLEFRAPMAFVGYGIIVTFKNLNVSSNPLYTSKALKADFNDYAPPFTDATDDDANKAIVRDWIQNEWDGGGNLLFLVNLDNDNAATISGGGVFMGDIMSNGGFTNSGGSALFGSVSSHRKLTVSGPSVIWYTGPNMLAEGESGSTVAMPDGIRLLSYAEW